MGARGDPGGTPTLKKNVNPSEPYILLGFVRFFPSEKRLGAVRHRQKLVMKGGRGAAEGMGSEAETLRAEKCFDDR